MTNSTHDADAAQRDSAPEKVKVGTPAGLNSEASTAPKCSPLLRQSANEAMEPEKAFQSLRAECALLGATLHRIDGDFGRPVFIVSRWALTKQLDSLADVRAWLHRVSGGKHGR